MMGPEDDQRLWQHWAEKIHGSGFGDWAALLLETLGPFSILGAQSIYMAKPYLGDLVPVAQLDSAARLLENSHLVKQFARMLREYPSA